MRPPRLTPTIEGPADGDTLFFVQGWPDHPNLWDPQIALLRDRYRCVRVELPNYEGGGAPRWGYSHEEMVLGLADCVRAVSPNQPVTLVGHDWGAYWSYWLHHHHPELVKRLIGLDIAPEMAPNLKEVALLVAYQWWLVAAFVFGGWIGNGMTRLMARILGAPRWDESVHAAMNFPYLYAWRDILTGKNPKIFAGYRPDLPHLFVYGVDKPGRFHTDHWLDQVRVRPENRVVALDGVGHWVPLDPRLGPLMRDWLDGVSVPTSAAS